MPGVYRPCKNITGIDSAQTSLAGTLPPIAHSAPATARRIAGPRHQFRYRQVRAVQNHGLSRAVSKPHKRRSKSAREVPTVRRALAEDDASSDDETDSEVEEWMEHVSTRVMSLPSMVCSAACGDLYMIPVQ